MAKQQQAPQQPPQPEKVAEQIAPLTADPGLPTGAGESVVRAPAAPAPAAPAVPAPGFGACYVFRLRQHIDGPFPNLWELSMLDPRGCNHVVVKKLISDADSLVFCLDNMQGELEADGL